MRAGERLGALSAPEARTFLSVAETARLLGMSEMTLYRAINEGEFPALRIRGRLIVPARAIEEMVEATLTTGRPVDTADWVRPGMRESDRGSVEVLPLIGFALFLLAAHAVFSGSVVALAAVGLGIIVAAVGFVVITLRRDRRVNEAGAAWLEAQQRTVVTGPASSHARDEVWS